MQATRPTSVVTPPATVSPPTDNPCLTRTTKVALASFASLAGFVFLPFGMASTLTAAVTVGAIVCCNENDTPQAPLDHEIIEIQASMHQIRKGMKELDKLQRQNKAICSFRS